MGNVARDEYVRLLADPTPEFIEVNQRAIDTGDWHGLVVYLETGKVIDGYAKLAKEWRALFDAEEMWH